jgi:hypothetical protein
MLIYVIAIVETLKYPLQRLRIFALANWDTSLITKGFSILWHAGRNCYEMVWARDV